MGILDQVMKMKTEGHSELEIISFLKNQGVSPKDIQNALGQSQIRDAVYDMQQSIMDDAPVEDTYIPQTYDQGSQMPSQNQYPSLPPIPQEIAPPEFQYQTQYQQPQAQYQYAQQYPQQSLGQEYYSPNDQENLSYDASDNFIDIAEQIYSEKTKKLQSQIEKLNEFKAIADSSIRSFEERLKRIEEVINQLQISILDKVGSYGKNIDSIKREMNMMQDSFSKVIDPFLDRYKK